MSQELYQQVILDHNKKPRNFGRLECPTHSAEGYNPLCGDHYFIDMKLSEEETIGDIAFSGEGCAISKASASIMTELVRGQSLKGAMQLADQFRHLLTEQVSEEELKKIGKLRVFEGVRRFPSRVKCAGLAWHALRSALNGEQSATTEG